MNPFKIRSILPEDIPFILATWTKSYLQNETWENLPQRFYYPAERHAIETILKLPQTTALILYPTEEPEIIIGYLVFAKTPKFNIVHYVYIKRLFNGWHFSNYLLEEAKLTGKTYYTRQTPKGESLKNKMNLKFIYYPHLV